MNIKTTLRAKSLLVTAATVAVAAMAVQAVVPSASAQDSTYSPDESLVVLGFTVEITGAGSGGDVDSAWETMSGGSLNIEVSESSVGTDQTHTTTPGHKYVDELTLRGPMTAASKAGRTGEGTYEILENGAGKFRVDLDGVPMRAVDAVSMEDLTIDIREDQADQRDEYRAYGPGDAHYGSVTIRSRVGKDSKELYQWWLDTSQGKNIRKSISVSLLNRAGEDARRYNFLECFPTTYRPFTELPGVAMEEIVARCEGVEFASAGDGSGARKALMEWLEGAVAEQPKGTNKSTGEPWKRTVVVTEILKDGAAGSTYTYGDGFPTRYVFPQLDSAGTGNLYEEVNIKPIRLDLS
jgi:phage tail-like protein